MIGKNLDKNKISLKVKLADNYFSTGFIDESRMACLQVLEFDPINEAALEVYRDICETGGALEGDLKIIEETVLSSNTSPSGDAAKAFGAVIARSSLTTLEELIRSRVEKPILPDWHAHLIYAGIMASRGKEDFAQIFSVLGLTLRAAMSTTSQNDIRLSNLRNTVPQSQPMVNYSVAEICIVSDFLNQRICKLAYALRKSGRIVHLLLVESTTVSPKLEKCFSKITRWNNIQNLAKIVISLCPIVFHVFCKTYSNYQAAFIVLCFGGGRLVIDFYDPFDPSVAPQRFEGDGQLQLTNLKILKLQRFLYDNAEGICCRILYPELTGSRRAGFVQQRIFLPEYCWGNVPSNKKLSDTDGKLHVIHGGSFMPEAVSGVEHTGFLWLARKAADLDVHFYLYAYDDQGYDFSEYKKIDSNSEHFHLLPPVSPEEYINDIAKYDAAVFIIYPTDEKERRKVQGTQDPRGTWGNKLGDHLDGGLYQLCNWRARSMNFILKRYGIGEPMTPKNKISKEFWDRVTDRVLNGSVDYSRAREALSIVNHGPRLIKFYNRVINLSVEGCKNRK